MCSVLLIASASIHFRCRIFIDATALSVIKYWLTGEIFMAKLPKRFEDSICKGLSKHEAAKAVRRIRKVCKDAEGALGPQAILARCNAFVDQRSGTDVFKV